MTIVDDFDAQAVANMMWSLAFLQYLPCHLWTALMKPFGDALLGIKGGVLVLAPCLLHDMCFAL